MRIVYFDIDSLRPDHLGCYGYGRPTSPAIDAVAADGTRFTHYYCADSPCMPSRHGLISGRFGINNGVVTHGGPASKLQIDERLYGGPQPHNQLLQRQIRENGYESICFSNFPYRHCATWFSLGWTEMHSPSLHSGSEPASEVAEPVLRRLRANADRDDYFLYINLWDPHRIYRMDPSWADRFHDFPVTQDWPDEEAIQAQQSDKGPFTSHGQFKDDKSAVPLMPGAASSRADFEHMVTGYDAAIAYTDHHVQLVLDELRGQGVYDESAVLISADHGDNFGEHGIYSDHVCADEAIHNVPLIVKWPDVARPGSVVDSKLYNVDLSATLCELTGSEPPEHYDGMSFADALKGDAIPERDHLVWGHGLYTLQRAVRTDCHLMIRTYDDFKYRFEETELYDMQEDRYQTRNLARSQPDTVARMERMLENWVDEQAAKPYAMPDPMMVEMERRKSRE
jgi:choline-sulfatase